MRNTRIAKPAFKIDERLGGLTIIGYVGFKPSKNDMRKDHYYAVKCSCGNIEIKTQNYLKRVESKLTCTTCTNALKRANYVPPKKNKVINNKALNKLWPI